MNVCKDCQHSSRKWFGRCPECGAWNTAVDRHSDACAVEVVNLSGPPTKTERLSCGDPEVDRVVGGGLVPGAVILLAGEPGIGKSTLVLQLMDGLLRRRKRTLLISGEESVDQIAMRARRLGANLDAFRVATTTTLSSVCSLIIGEDPEVVVIDSIQTLADDALDQACGSPLQVRVCASAMVKLAKELGVVIVLVGHVTKEGDVAGPKLLEHVVDAVLTLEGERTGSIRLLRAVKNRFGSCEETGVFIMSGSGLEAVPDPSAMFLADRREGVPGSCVFSGIEGTRPVLVEIQALVAPTQAPQARRVALGIDPKRLSLLLGILSRRAGISFANLDVFVAAAGGLTVREPAADLAICTALASIVRDVPTPARVIVVGEVGLAGEVRRVPAIERRLSEARRLGFDSAIVPHGSEPGDMRQRVVTAETLSDALGAALRPEAAVL